MDERWSKSGVSGRHLAHIVQNAVPFSHTNEQIRHPRIRFNALILAKNRCSPDLFLGSAAFPCTPRDESRICKTGPSYASSSGTSGSLHRRAAWGSVKAIPSKGMVSSSSTLTATEARKSKENHAAE